jgi:predicted transcriptional regulator
MYDAVPTELTALPQWVTWRFEPDPKHPDKPKKVPYSPQSGRRASTTNAQTWATFAVAVRAQASRRHDGVGFVFSPDDPFVGIDLDDCIAEGEIAPWAQAILDTMQSYSEVSPSGQGIKLIIAGELPNDAAVKTEHIEIYGKGRYFTITGQHVADTPTTVRNVNGELAKLVEATRPKPAALPALDTRPAAPEYLRVWADRIIDDAVSRVALAAPNTHHNTRLDMARWVGGLIPHGLADAEGVARRLYQARIPQAHHQQEYKAILDGLRLGADKPLELPEPPPQPLFDAAGVAYCPTHRVALPTAKNGNGYKCHQKDDTTATGWCDFWWKGEGYTQPTRSESRTLPRNGADAGSGTTDAASRTDGIGNVGQPPIAPTVVDRVSAPATLAGQASRFVLYSIAALRDLPPVVWLLEGEIPAHLFTVVCGPSGAGKSLLGVDYAIRVARRYADSAVIYVAAEGGSGYRARVDAWLAHHQIEEPTNLHFVVRDVPLLEPLAVAEFIATIQPHKPCLVFFDTLARCMVGGDENSAKDMGLLIRGCDTVRHELGAAVVVVHHAGKSGSGYRGSSALYAAADNWIDVSNDDGLITVSGGKAKDWKPFDPRYLRMVEAGESIVLVPHNQVDMKKAALSEGQRKVLETLAMDIFLDAGAKRAELVTATGLAETTIYKVLSRLKRDTMIIQSKKGDPYTIAAKGLATIRDYHRALRQQNAQLSQLSSNYTELSEPGYTNYTNYISPPLGGDREIVDSSGGESLESPRSEPTEELFPDDSPLASIPEHLRLTTRMMLNSDLEQNQEAARQRCEAYGADYEAARAYVRGGGQ